MTFRNGLAWCQVSRAHLQDEGLTIIPVWHSPGSSRHLQRHDVSSQSLCSDCISQLRISSSFVHSHLLNWIRASIMLMIRPALVWDILLKGITISLLCCALTPALQMLGHVHCLIAAMHQVTKYPLERWNLTEKSLLSTTRTSNVTIFTLTPGIIY